VRERRGVGEVVDRDHLELRVPGESAEENAADATETVDTDTNSHVRIPSRAS